MLGVSADVRMKEADVKAARNRCGIVRNKVFRHFSFIDSGIDKGTSSEF
jgi:hypothetical protein